MSIEEIMDELDGLADQKLEATAIETYKKLRPVYRETLRKIDDITDGTINEDYTEWLKINIFNGKIPNEEKAKEAAEVYCEEFEFSDDYF